MLEKKINKYNIKPETMQKGKSSHLTHEWSPDDLCCEMYGEIERYTGRENAVFTEQTNKASHSISQWLCG